MKAKLLISVFLILTAGLGFALSQAADPASTVAGGATASNPYTSGERLRYVGKYKKFGFAFTIAEMVFNVSRKGGNSEYHVVSEARSKGTLAKLFSFSFYQKIESTIDAPTLRIIKSEKRDEQRKRVRDSKADFDYKKKIVTWVETDPKDLTRPPKKVASTITEDVQDMVTAVYMLRGKDLAVGRRFVFKVSDSGLVYDVPVVIAARERKKSVLGKRWCWRVEPEIFGDGRIIEQKGRLTIWITDDRQRIPIRAKLKTELGRVDIKLRKAVNVDSRPSA